MKKYKNIILSVILIIFLLNIKIVLSSVKYASILFFNKVFVCVFPFIILCDILIYYDYHIFLKNIFGSFLSKIFKIDKNSSIIFIISILCASPTNAVIIKDMIDKKQINEQTGIKMLSFTSFSTISFVIGTIGVFLYKSVFIGFILWLITLINNILIGIYLRKENIVSDIKIEASDKTNILLLIKNSTLKAIENSFIILGNLIIFTIIINLFIKYIHINDILSSIIIGTLEITNGVILVSKLNIDLFTKLLLTSYMLTFSSLSILFQSFSILSKYKINIKKILILRLVFSSIYLLIALLMHSGSHYFLF